MSVSLRIEREPRIPGAEQTPRGSPPRHTRSTNTSRKILFFRCRASSRGASLPAAGRPRQGGPPLPQRHLQCLGCLRGERRHPCPRGRASLPCTVCGPQLGPLAKGAGAPRTGPNPTRTPPGSGVGALGAVPGKQRGEHFLPSSLSSSLLWSPSSFIVGILRGRSGPMLYLRNRGVKFFSDLYPPPLGATFVQRQDWPGLGALGAVPRKQRCKHLYSSSTLLTPVPSPPPPSPPPGSILTWPGLSGHFWRRCRGTPLNTPFPKKWESQGDIPCTGMA